MLSYAVFLSMLLFASERAKKACTIGEIRNRRLSYFVRSKLEHWDEWKEETKRVRTACFLLVSHGTVALGKVNYD